MQGGQMLSVAKLRIIRASALWRMRRSDEAIGALGEAVRLLRNQPFRRFILDEELTTRKLLGFGLMMVAMALIAQKRPIDEEGRDRRPAEVPAPAEGATYLEDKTWNQGLDQGVTRI